ncbi:unnamed protein product [Caenorhabditis brenneri]
MKLQLFLFFVLAMVQFSPAQNTGEIINESSEIPSSTIGNATGRLYKFVEMKGMSDARAVIYISTEIHVEMLE